MVEMPQIDIEKCNGCGVCVIACYCGAIIIENGKARVIESLRCGWCTVCEAVCPVGALTCPYEIVIEG